MRAKRELVGVVVEVQLPVVQLHAVSHASLDGHDLALELAVAVLDALSFPLLVYESGLELSDILLQPEDPAAKDDELYCVSLLRISDVLGLFVQGPNETRKHVNRQKVNKTSSGRSRVIDKAKLQEAMDYLDSRHRHKSATGVAEPAAGDGEATK